MKNGACTPAWKGGNSFDGLTRLGLRSRLDTTSRFGLVLNYDAYRERLPCGCVDYTSFADMAITYRFAQSEAVQFHAGVGMRGLFDSRKTRGGVNFLYSVDVFPVQPVVLSAQVEMGNLKEAFAMRLRGSAGVMWRNVEAFVGYDWLRVGGVDLCGPMAGVRLWF